MAEVKVRRALLSVYDKTGLADFASALHDEFGIEIISTGGTAQALREAGIPVTLVEDLTGFPEMLGGRVKTLHPKIHAAILADRDNPEHMRQLKETGIEPIDMVVVNLYPFEQTIARPDCTFEQAIEMIDIGGPSLLRAAAKNHEHVVCVASPRWYEGVLKNLRKDGGSTELAYRRELAFLAYRITCQYDREVWLWLRQYVPWTRVYESVPFGERQFWPAKLQSRLRYGENPHQGASAYRLDDTSEELNLLDATVLAPQELSFNNYADASAALELCTELTRAGRNLWDRSLTGRLTGHRISEERLTRRHLPHIQRPQATYFVTFRLRHGQLAPDERDIVLAACRFWHGKKMTLHAVTVMPDHVHLLLTPHEVVPGHWPTLGELLKSIKGFSSQEINKRRGGSGLNWLDESFDRVVRDEAEFHEKWAYMEANAVTAGLVARPEDYPWFWRGSARYLELEECDRSETGPTRLLHDRSETGPTVSLLNAVCFIKHTNACGVAVHADPLEAYRKAYLGDPNAALGGILAVNFPVDAVFADAVMETYPRWGKAAGAGGFFVEVWLAPSFTDDAVNVIRTKKEWGQRVRLLAVGDMDVPPDPHELDFKKISGGMLVQTRDLVGLHEAQWQVVTQRPPTEAEISDLHLAWLVAKHTKSNAVSICKDGLLIGNGAGQMSRVMSCRVATWLARDNRHDLHGAVAASDGFFPFRDGPDLLADAGIMAIIQPGGSKRDQDVVDACNERGLAMIFTGTRHFKH